ncbi:MAG: UpxY family transcription antiterminator [Bacteroidota bacterium]
MEQEKNWNVVYTASRQEKKVALKLSEHNIENYLPIIKVLSQWSDRKKLIEKPLFNGYVFVKETNDYEQILKITGVVAFLKYNKKNAIVRQHEIDTIKSLIAYGYDITTFDQSETIELGEQVMVADGPLKGQVGELYSKSDAKWFVIHFENFGNSLKVKLPSNLLKPIK